MLFLATDAVIEPSAQLVRCHAPSRLTIEGDGDGATPEYNALSFEMAKRDNLSAETESCGENVELGVQPLLHGRRTGV